MADWYEELQRQIREGSAPPAPPLPEAHGGSPLQPSFEPPRPAPTPPRAPPPAAPARTLPPELGGEASAYHGKPPRQGATASDALDYLQRTQRGQATAEHALTLPPGDARKAEQARGSVEAEGRSTYLPEAFGQPYDQRRAIQGLPQQPQPLPEPSVSTETQAPAAQSPPQQPPPQAEPPVPGLEPEPSADAKVEWPKQLLGKISPEDHAALVDSLDLFRAGQLTSGAMHAETHSIFTKYMTKAQAQDAVVGFMHSVVQSKPKYGATLQISPESPPAPTAQPTGEPIPGLGQLRQGPPGGVAASFQQAAQPAPPPMGLGDVVGHVMNTVAQSAVGVVGGLAKDVGITAQFINKIVSDSGGDLNDYATWKIGSAMEAYAKSQFPEDPRAQASFLLTTVPRAFGAGLAYMSGGFAGGLSRMAVSSGVTGALGMGATAQQEAEAAGASQATQAAAMMFGQVIGATNALPWQSVLSAADKVSGGTLRKALVAGGVGAATNWVTQMVQSGAMNAFAHALYDEGREVFTAAGLEQANAGAIVGVVLGTVMGAAQSQTKLRQDAFREDTPTPANKILGSPSDMTAEASVPQPPAGKLQGQQSILSGGPPTPKPSGPPAEPTPPSGAAPTPPTPTAEASNMLQQPNAQTAPLQQLQGQPATSQAAPLPNVPRGLHASEPTQVQSGQAEGQRPQYRENGPTAGNPPQAAMPGMQSSIRGETSPELRGTAEGDLALSGLPSETAPGVEPPPFITPRDRQLASAGQPLHQTFGPQNQTLDQLLSPLHPHEIANVQPMPMEGNPKPDNLREIIKRAQEGIQIPLRFGSVPKGIGGYYDPSAGGIRVKFQGDLGATAHELAHGLDDKLHIISDWVNQPQQTPFDNELKPFWSGGRASQPAAGASPLEQLAYHRKEGVAEWFRSYLINPRETERRTPEFTAYIHGMMPEQSFSAMNQLGADLRAFVNATGHDQMMANIEWKPPKSNLLQLNGDPNHFQITAWDNLKTEMTDRLHPYMKAIDFAKQIGDKKVLPANDPEILTRLLSGIHSKVDDIVEHGLVRPGKAFTDPDYRMTGPFKELIPDGVDRAEIESKMQQVATYMFAQRSLEKMPQLGHEIMTWGAGVEPSPVILAKRMAEFDALPPEQQAEITHYATKYREWADANLRTLVEKGRMSEETYGAIKASNQYYAAMQRLSEVSPEEPIIGQPAPAGSGELGTKKEVVHRMVGSTKSIHNPYDSLLEATYRVTREADRNEAMRAFTDLLDQPRPMHAGEVKPFAELGVKLIGKPDKMDNVITIFKEGRPEYWQLQPDVFQAVSRTNDMEYHLPRALTLLPSIMRKTIVNSPPFQIRNFVRDMFQRAVVSDVGSHPLASFPAIRDIWTGNAELELGGMAQAGALQAGHYMKDRQSYHQVMEHAIGEVLRDGRHILLDPQGMGYAVNNFMQAGETAGRLAEFRAAFKAGKDQGMDDLNAQTYAAGKARGILDFAQAGRTARMINQAIPFTTASIRGPLRALAAAQNDPALFARQWGLYVLAPTLAVKAWNYQWGDDEEMRKQPYYRRDLFWNVKVGPDTIFSMPRPFELGVMASGVERAIDALHGAYDQESFGKELSHAFEGYPKALWKSLMPFDEATLFPLVPGLVEGMVNYDSFRNRPIVPRHEEDLDLDLRKGASKGSRLGKGISEALVQAGVAVDPRYVDHFIKRQFGYAGLYAESLSDIGRTDKKGMTALQALGMGTSDPVFANPDVSWILERAKGRGIRPSKTGEGAPLRRLHELMSRYNDSTDNVERDAIAHDVLENAKDLRGQWEARAPQTKAQRKKSAAAAAGLE